MCEDKATVRAKSFKIVRTKMQGHRVQRALHACELSIDEVDKLFCLFPSFSKLTATLHIVLNDNCMYLESSKKKKNHRTTHLPGRADIPDPFFPLLCLFSKSDAFMHLAIFKAFWHAACESSHPQA